MAGRKSAGSGLRVLEAVVHPRLPMRRAVVRQLEAESLGEGEGGSADEERLDGLDEEMDVEESARATDITPVDSLHSVPEEQEARKEVEQPPPALRTEAKLPSFVVRWDAISSSTIPSDDKITTEVKPTLTLPVETLPSSVIAAATALTRSESRVNEIFNTGVWKTVQSNKGDAEEEEEEEEIPEIDMGLDSDEE